MYSRGLSSPEIYSECFIESVKLKSILNVAVSSEPAEIPLEASGADGTG